ncbi:hypothetical protein ACHAWU_008211 [Discostella pseudostelligera]|uniref:Uncharacterized protein n=1 Tax=Discostella pseudostelligera TaxID=259834 RepID=A0ABD3M7V3_9STRA
MYGMNDNQNYFTDGKRTTSRVTNEPGGKSTVKLGWDSPKAKEPKPSNEGKMEKKETLMKVDGTSATTTTTTTASSSATKRKMSDRSTGSGISTDSSSSHSHSGSSSSSSSSRGISSNAYANGASQNTGNVITDRPTSRVTQPPGGVSSISFC